MTLSDREKDELLTCKDVHHDWEEDIPLGASRRASWGKRRIYVCRSCGSQRLETVNGFTGLIDVRFYKLSKRYKDFCSGMSKADARLERMKIRSTRGRKAS